MDLVPHLLCSEFRVFLFLWPSLLCISFSRAALLPGRPFRVVLGSERNSPPFASSFDLYPARFLFPFFGFLGRPLPLQCTSYVFEDRFL